MADEESDGVNLPPGKLQDLKKLFEEKNAQTSDPSPGKVLGARGRSVLPATPPKPIPGASVGHPKPAPRQVSPAKRNMAMFESSVASSFGSASVDEDPLVNYGTVPRPRRRTASKGQEWSSTLERKSAAQKKLSPKVSRRVAMFSDENKMETGDDKEEERTGVVRRFPSPGTKSGSPKRLSDPCSDVDSSSGRKTSAERRKTMDNFSIDNAETRTGEVKVQDQIRKFQEKPSLPKKPVIANAAQQAPISGSPPKPVAKSSENADTAYDVPWDLKPGKNIERLKAISGDQHSPQKGKSPAQDSSTPAAKDKGDGKSTLPRSKPQVSRQLSRPTEQPPPPPSKPPRTFVHSEYLEGKAEGQSAHNLKKGHLSEGDPKLSATQGSSGVEEEVTLRVPGKSSHTPSIQEPRETKGIREKPPSRPPPPRPRPISEASTLNRRKASPRRTNVSDADEDEGPVVISLRTGRPILRQVSVSGPHRKPDDQLPERPEREASLQRFPLRKSYSSECLYKGSMSSLSDMGTEEESSWVMVQSYHPGDSGEPIYEALIDTEGYAVPNQFLRRLPPNDQIAKVGPGLGSKPGFLKRFLAPSSAPGGGPPATTPIKDQDVEKVSAKKMNLVKQKINQAYEALQVVFRGPLASDEGDQENATTEEQDSMDMEGIVDMKEIKQRVTYCSTVRLKTLQSVKRTREFMDKIYPQLFEYALIVGLSAKTDDPGYDPIILHKFPQTRNYKVGDHGHLLFFAEMVESNMSVPKFCFPDAEEFRPGSVTSTSESYSFVLTDVDGNRMYGYCRRVQPRDASLPEVICIISPIDAFNMYNKLLSEIEARRFKSLDHAQEMIAASFGRPMPKPGKVCHIRALDENGEMETVFLDRPSDPRLVNVNYESLLMYLGTDKLIQVFASMLMERRLILCSKQLSILTQTVHALVALLYPFQWQHVYIPLLPLDMLDVCESPTPFIIGVLRSHLDRVRALALEDVIIVDVDHKQVLRSMGDEGNLLPRKVQKALKTAINMCKIDSELENKEDAQHSQWLMVSEAFLRMFLETMGHFVQHVSTQQNNTKTFMKEQFIAAAPSKGIRQFLEWFTETQMFEVFITMYLEKQHWGSMDLFMSRLGELQKKRQTEGSPVKGIGQKVKNLGKALKTKLKE